MANYTSTEYCDFLTAGDNLGFKITEFFLIPNPGYQLSVNDFTISGLDVEASTYAPWDFIGGPYLYTTTANFIKKQWTSSSNPLDVYNESPVSEDNVLPDGIAAVIMMNTSLDPFNETNQVRVLVIPQYGQEMPSGNKTVEIDIDGDANPFSSNQSTLSVILTNYIYPQYNSNYIDMDSPETSATYLEQVDTSNVIGVSDYGVEYPLIVSTTQVDNLVQFGRYPWQLSLIESSPGIINAGDISNYLNFSDHCLYPGHENDPADTDDFPTVPLDGVSGWLRDIGGYTFFGAPAKWTRLGRLDWNNYEKIRKQNPNIIENCTIVPYNSPVNNEDTENTWSVNTNPNMISDTGSGTLFQMELLSGENYISGTPTYTLEEQPHNPAIFKITPDDGYTLAAVDFYCHNSDCRGKTNKIETQTIGSTFGNTLITPNYYATWENTITNDNSGSVASNATSVPNFWTWYWQFNSSDVIGGLYSEYETAINNAATTTSYNTFTSLDYDTYSQHALSVESFDDLVNTKQKLVMIQKQPAVFFRWENSICNPPGWGALYAETNTNYSEILGDTGDYYLLDDEVNHFGICGGAVGNSNVGGMKNGPTAGIYNMSPITQVLFRDSADPNTSDNEVFVEVYFNFDHTVDYPFTFSPISGSASDSFDLNTYYIQINGIARELNSWNSGGIMRSGEMPFDIELVDSKNSGTITITNNNTSKIKKITKRGGFYDERDVYNISGKVKPNKSTVVATVKIEATKDTNNNYTHYFQKAPNLIHDKLLKSINIDVKNKIKLVLKSSGIERTSLDNGSKITSYTYDLVYLNDVATSKSNTIRTKIKYKDTQVVSRSLSIDRVKYGNTLLNQNGENRDIVIYGTPNTPFEMTINKITRVRDYSAQVSSRAGHPIYPTVNIIEESILSKYKSNSTYKDRNNNTFLSISDKIGANGKYTCRQKFPKVPTIVKTAISGSGAASGATKIIFDNLAGVEIGDRLMMKEIPSSSMITVVTLDPDDDKWSAATGYEVELSSSVTAADDATAVFMRGTEYGINVTSDYTSGGIASTYLSSGIPTDYPSYILRQPLNPVITFRATTVSRSYSISSQAIPGAGIQTYDLTYTGRPGTSKKFTITYLLDLTNGAHTFNLIRVPFFSSTNSMQLYSDNTYKNGSHWTNSIPAQNGGTDVSISTTTTAAGANTITLTCIVNINSFGENNVIMELDLDNIVSHP